MTTSLMDVFSGGKPKPEKEESKPRIIAETNYPARDFIQDLISWLERGKTEPPRAPGLHASSLWKTCPRKPLLEVLHGDEVEPERLRAGQHMTFDTGSSLHGLMQNTYLGMFGRLWGNWLCLGCSPGEDGEPKIVHTGTMPETCPECGAPWRYNDGTQNILYSEMPVVEEALQYRGHCDGIILGRDLKTRRVFEFKTISKSQYKDLREAKRAHVIQVHAYMHALELREAIIVYWDKGSQCDWSRSVDGKWEAGRPHLKAYLVEFDDALWGSMTTKIADHHAATKMVKELPVVTDEHVMQFKRICTHMRCDLALECDYRDHCFRLPK